MLPLLQDGSKLRRRQPAVPELRNLKNSLTQRLAGLVLPDNPLDMLIDALGGPENVAEMTGRTTRIVRRPDTRRNPRSSGTRGGRGARGGAAAADTGNGNSNG